MGSEGGGKLLLLVDKGFLNATERVPEIFFIKEQPWYIRKRRAEEGETKFSMPNNLNDNRLLLNKRALLLINVTGNAYHNRRRGGS